jgi:hypothetical protein
LTQSTEQNGNRLDRLEQLAETTLLAIGQLAQRQNEYAAVTDAHIQAVTTGIDELAVSVRELRAGQVRLTASLEQLTAGQEQQSRVLDYLLSFCSSSPAIYAKHERREECERVDDTHPTNAVGEGG